MQIPKDQLLEQLSQLERRYTELEQRAAQLAGNASESQAYQELSRELSDLREIVTMYRTYRRVDRDAAEAETLLHAQGDLELRELAKEEAVSLRQQQAQLLGQLEQLWLERHEVPERPLIVEIRAATGGLEASKRLFQRRGSGRTAGFRQRPGGMGRKRGIPE